MIETIKDIFVPQDIFDWIGLIFIVVLWSLYVKFEVIDKRVWKENKTLSILLFVAVYIVSLGGYQVIKMLGYLLF